MLRLETRATVALLLVFICLPVAFAQSPADELASQWVEAFDAGDAAGLASLYTDDAMLRHANAAVDQGSGEIEEFAQQYHEMGWTFEFGPASFEALADDVAYSIGPWTAFDADGQPLLRAEAFRVYVKADGEWRIHRDFSASVPDEEE